MSSIQNVVVPNTAEALNPVCSSILNAARFLTNPATKMLNFPKKSTSYFPNSTVSPWNDSIPASSRESFRRYMSERGRICYHLSQRFA